MGKQPGMGMSRYYHLAHYCNLARYFINTENRPISNHLSININGNQIHRLNLNMLVVGGSGAGKSQFVARPVLMQQSGSFIITDPKGELLQTCGQMLMEAGYDVKVLNLLDANGMATSNHYNPFMYIKSETDIQKLITNLFANTTKEGETAPDPFWENAERMLLTALFLYTWMEKPKEEQNFRTVMDLLAKAEFQTDARGNKLDSELDKIFDELEIRCCEDSEFKGDGFVCRHPAVLAYNKVMRGAADTVRSIIISANSRLINVNEDILALMDDDEMNIQEIGAGVSYDGKTKTAVFCVIPDNDKTYSFVIGMFYTQIFQQLYFYADFMSGKRSLPIHVTFLLDEFANVALPEDFLSELSTMRSRNISAIPIIQNFAQIKSMYKESKWESIPGNCDTILYLGGNEQSTHEYFSKSLGEGTYDKSTYGETKGTHGSSSQNYDKYGRKLLTESEVREIDPSDCLIFIRGQKPIIDKKYDTFNHPLWYKVAGANFEFDASEKRKLKQDDIHAVSMVSVKMFDALKRKEDYDNKLKPKERKVHRCFELTFDDLMNIDVNNPDISGQKQMFDEKRMAYNRKKMEETKRVQRENSIEGIAGKYVLEVMKLRKAEYELEQIKVLMSLIKKGIKVEEILKSFNPKMNVEEMRLYTDLMLK